MNLPEVSGNPRGRSACPSHINIELCVTARSRKSKAPTFVPSSLLVLHRLHYKKVVCEQLVLQRQNIFLF